MELHTAKRISSHCLPILSSRFQGWTC